MNSYIASHENATRASPDESDAFHRRLSGATSGRRLPPAQRWRLRKLADTKVRLKVMSLNIGTVTGKSRELADTMTRRKIDIARKGRVLGRVGGAGKVIFREGQDCYRSRSQWAYWMR